MKKMEERDRRKMDEMKKKLHTDDEGNILKNFISLEFLYVLLQHKFCIA